MPRPTARYALFALLTTFFLLTYRSTRPASLLPNSPSTTDTTAGQIRIANLKSRVTNQLPVAKKLQKPFGDDRPRGAQGGGGEHVPRPVGGVINGNGREVGTNSGREGLWNKFEKAGAGRAGEQQKWVPVQGQGMAPQGGMVVAAAKMDTREGGPFGEKVEERGRDGKVGQQQPIRPPPPSRPNQPPFGANHKQVVDTDTDSSEHLDSPSDEEEEIEGEEEPEADEEDEDAVGRVVDDDSDDAQGRRKDKGSVNRLNKPYVKGNGVLPGSKNTKKMKGMAGKEGKDVKWKGGWSERFKQKPGEGGAEAAAKAPV
ncbi:hypothetical protein P7C70_g4840, partial [Phenoliferia sp. Uapishka_3]